MIDKATTIIGDKAATLCTSARGKYLNEVTKNAVSSTEVRAVSYTHLTLPTNREV